MLSMRATERLAGVLLVVSFLLFLGHVVTLMTVGVGLATLVFVLLYGFPISLAGLTLYAALRRHDRTLAMFGAFGLASHGLFVVLTAVLLLAGMRFPDEFATFGAQPSALSGAASSLELGMDKIRTSAFAFLGLGLLALGVLIAWSGAVARWVGWLGIVAGGLALLAMLGRLAGVLEGVTGVTRSIALAAFVFMLVLGVRLLARQVHACPSA